MQTSYYHSQQIARLRKKATVRLWKFYLEQREFYRRMFRTYWKFRHLSGIDGRLRQSLDKLKTMRTFAEWMANR